MTMTDETANLLADLGYPPEGVQLQSSRLTPLPNGTQRLTAQNPVFVLWGHRGPGIVGHYLPYRGVSDPRSRRSPGAHA